MLLKGGFIPQRYIFFKEENTIPYYNTQFHTTIPFYNNNASIDVGKWWFHSPTVHFLQGGISNFVKRQDIPWTSIPILLKSNLLLWFFNTKRPKPVNMTGCTISGVAGLVALKSRFEAMRVLFWETPRNLNHAQMKRMAAEPAVPSPNATPAGGRLARTYDLTL
ncbi:hypothetical protein AVEN_232296-1 [Araneus ventricosus]|uniref:Uncharacterized protein n=1 Tax=Araneus ventricosus TaxID=182803 RepID=A0A4Y2JVS4_ARAVE|nr:hypothetical protein AVEN_232296-1 [Araneus ventricosus]